MEDKHTTVVSFGGFTTLLQIAFIVLKLCGVIDWHWALVLLPIIIEVGLVMLISVIAIIIAVWCDR